MSTLIMLLLLLFGLALHFLKKIVEARRNGKDIGIKEYWTDHPYAALFSVVGGLAVFTLLYGTPELTKTTAFSIGFMADSVANMFSKRGMKNI